MFVTNVKPGPSLALYFSIPYTHGHWYYLYICKFNTSWGGGWASYSCIWRNVFGCSCNAGPTQTIRGGPVNPEIDVYGCGWSARWFILRYSYVCMYVHKARKVNYPVGSEITHVKGRGTGCSAGQGYRYPGPESPERGLTLISVATHIHRCTHPISVQCRYLHTYTPTPMHSAHAAAQNA